MVTAQDVGPIMETNSAKFFEKLDQLRTELIESAYALDTRGQHQAADVAMRTSARLGELWEEHAAGWREGRQV